MSLPVAFAQLHVSPAIPDFLQAYSGIELDLLLSDSMVNLVEECVDMAIRIGSLDSSSLVARKLAPQRRILCAGHAYIAQHGEPRTPGDLANHRCLSFSYGRGDRSWRFARNNSEQVVRVSGPIRINNSLILRDAALEDSGIILMPSWLVGDNVATGRLRLLLPDWEASPGAAGAAIHAVYLPNRKNSKKVRAFVDFLTSRFGTPPFWDKKQGQSERPT